MTLAANSAPAAKPPPARTSPATPPPFLLTMGDYHGTLAAARALGRDGIPVQLADPRLLSRSRWSRWVETRFCPPVSSPDAFIHALIEMGRASPGRVLYPTSDDTAFLFALHRRDLEAYYRTYQPPLSGLYQLMNKKRLLGLCAELGIPAPATLFPADRHEVERLAPGLRYPVLIKPQTQIQFLSQVKGLPVASADRLAPTYDAFVRRNRYGTAIVRHDPGVQAPMLQEYQPEARDGIYSLAGFVDRAGQHAFRASRKVLQRPSAMGVGVCFEAAPVLPELTEQVLALCRRAGYHGALEVEFIRAGDRHLLIDFNGRFYGQMGFEIARGLPLPRLVHAAACGDELRVRRELASCAEPAADAPTAYCYRGHLDLVLRVQTALGRISPQERRAWRDWLASHGDGVVDAVYDASDPGPSLVDVLGQLARAVRHPRAYVRTMLFDSAEGAASVNPGRDHPAR